MKNFKQFVESYGKKKEMKEEEGCPCCGGGECKCSADCPDCDCKSVKESSCGSSHTKKEELSPKQKQLDVDKDGDIEGDDLAALRAKKKNK
jgi:hypothetical protein